MVRFVLGACAILRLVECSGHVKLMMLGISDALTFSAIPFLQYIFSNRILCDMAQFVDNQSPCHGNDIIN